MNRMRKEVLLPVVAAAAVFLLVGCNAMRSGGGATEAMANMKGDVTELLDAPLTSSVEAAASAFSTLQFAKIDQSSDLLGARLIGKTFQGKKVIVLLRKVTDSHTEVAIRVGVFGDKFISRQVFDEIQKALSAAGK